MHVNMYFYLSVAMAIDFITEAIIVARVYGIEE